MNGIPSPPRIEFDPFGAAVGGALVCGGLSVLLPLLLAPTATLAALAVPAWVSLLRRRGSLPLHRAGAGSMASLAVLACASVAFLVGPPVLAPVRGLLLAGALVPLFVSERNRSAIPSRLSRA